MAEEHGMCVKTQDKRYQRIDDRPATTRRVKDYLWPKERKSVKELMLYYKQELKKRE